MRLYLLVMAFVAFVVPAVADDHFERSVRPILTQRCVGCHGSSKQEGGLRLDSRQGWQRGGSHGPAIQPGIPEQSLLIRALTGSGGLNRMPPDAPLSEGEFKALTKWIREGAADPRTAQPTKTPAQTLSEARRWWAYQPVKRPAVPAKAKGNPIDGFIAQRLAAKGLNLSPPADRRTLIRRASYDLTGLPPTHSEVSAFLQDPAPNAFAKVVDRLVASPRYGERWGRHWLDLVRYADTAGENADYPLQHAWRYRNWVIEAFNRDMPYNQFVKEQIAGDLLAAKSLDSTYSSKVIATGYLAVARRFEHDSDKNMHLTYEDAIDNMGKVFLGLTLGCARCHDHKYDAISAKDYYALYGIFESTRLSFPGCEAKQRPRDMVPLLPPSEWVRVVKPYQDKLARFEDRVKAETSAQLQQSRVIQTLWEKSRESLSSGQIPDGGTSQIDTKPISLNVMAGEVILLSITPLGNHGADTTQVEIVITEENGRSRTWSATRDLLSGLSDGNPVQDAFGNARVWWLFDVRNQPTLLPERKTDIAGKNDLVSWQNGDTPSVLINRGMNEVSVWTKLPPRALFAHPAPNGNVAIGWLSPISGRISIRGLVKDAHPGGSDGVGWVLERFGADVRDPLSVLAEAGPALLRLAQERSALLAAAPQQELAYAAAEGKPSDAKLQMRGDPEKLGDLIPRRWLQVLGGNPIGNPAESGRMDLADWIASPNNPLTARVMANRIWLLHFGKGLVRTPNDFGVRGAPPSHPELLDWLASRLIQSGWSLKAMHREIMLSKVYQQASLDRPEGQTVDPLNDLYWRAERRRLSAEEIRDSLLLTSGQLDLSPAQAHPIPPESTWTYTQHVPFSSFYETNRRSVYLIQVRNRRHPFLGLFDGADPNATTPQRQATTVPTQALYFMNDPFFHAQAAKLAEGLPPDEAPSRMNELCQRVFQRTAVASDQEFARAFLDKYRTANSTLTAAEQDRQGWAALARILLASNEFLYVD